MSLPVRPETTDEMVYQLWYAVIGSNGDGLASQIRDARKRIEGIENALPGLLTSEEHEKIETEKVEKIERRKLTAREKAMLAATFLGSVAAAASVIVALSR